MTLCQIAPSVSPNPWVRLIRGITVKSSQGLRQRGARRGKEKERPSRGEPRGIVPSRFSGRYKPPLEGARRAPGRRRRAPLPRRRYRRRVLLRILAWASAGLALAVAALLFHWTHTAARPDGTWAPRSSSTRCRAAASPRSRPRRGARRTAGRGASWARRIRRPPWRRALVPGSGGRAAAAALHTARRRTVPGGRVDPRRRILDGRRPLDVGMARAAGSRSRRGALVASIGYRMAPEDPFPAAVDDSFAGLRFVAAHAGEWRGDASRLAVMGGSAGGNLAAVMALRAARDEGGPRAALPGAARSRCSR